MEGYFEFLAFAEQFVRTHTINDVAVAFIHLHFNRQNRQAEVLFFGVAQLFVLLLVKLLVADRVGDRLCQQCGVLPFRNWLL